MLKATGLRKEFSSTVAVDGLSLEVKRGEIVGLIGPNGAGKTTTIRMILNIIKPDAGTITFDGKPFDEGIRNRLGYLPEERGLYRKNKLLNTILYFAGLKGVDSAEAKRRAYQWLKRFDLLDYYQRRVEELSKGNQQKVQFIISILHEPQLVILDEPFSGLDPVNQILLKDILQELKQQGRAIILSTHQMEEAERLSDLICLINGGKLVLEGSMKGLKQRFGVNSVRLEFEGDGLFLKNLPCVRNAIVYENYAELIMRGSVPSDEIIREISPRLDIRKFEYVEPSLNSIFIDVVGTPERRTIAEPGPAVARKPQEPIRRDKGLNRDGISAGIFGLAAFAVFAAKLFMPGISWSVVAIFAAGAIASGYKFLMKRKRKPYPAGNEEKEERTGA